MRWSSVLIVLTLLAPSALARKLPRHRPTDFTVTYFQSGGIRGGGRNETIGGKTPTIAATDVELDRLYVTLRRARADRIRSKKEPSADRGGVTITITAGGHTWTCDDAGQSVVIARDQPRMAKIVAAVEAVIAAHDPTAPQTE